MAVRSPRLRKLDRASAIHHTVFTSLRMTPDLREAVQAYADRERITLQAAIERLLQRGLGLPSDE